MQALLLKFIAPFVVLGSLLFPQATVETVRPNIVPEKFVNPVSYEKVRPSMRSGWYEITAVRPDGSEYQIGVREANGKAGNALDIRNFSKTKSDVASALLGDVRLGGQGEYEGYVNGLAAALDQQSEGRLGASLVIPTSVALFETTLAAQISSSATSFTLTSATDKEGTTLASSTYAFIIDEGTASEEMVIADCTSTACTNVQRGISVITGTSTVSASQKAHRRAASVKITDGPQLLILSRILNGIGTIPNKLSYTSHPTFTSNTELIDKKYADDLAFAGAPDSSATVKGVVEKATGAEAAAGAAVGSGNTSAALGLTADIATSTCQAAGNFVMVTPSDGKISSTCVDLTEGYSWSGVHTWSGAGSYLYSSGAALVGIGTSTPLKPLEVGGSGVFGDNVRASSFTATSTTATSTAVNFQATNNATTTNLFVSGACTGCPTTYSASSTAFTVTTGTVTYTGSIPTTTNMGLGSYTITGQSAGQAHKGTFMFTRAGLTTFSLHYAEGAADTDLATYTFTWSGNNVSIEEVTDANTNTSIAGTIYWYK